jgi:hypothetical protein
LNNSMYLLFTYLFLICTFNFTIHRYVSLYYVV